jgi:tyrosine-protein kinase Etk/Wzc
MAKYLKHWYIILFGVALGLASAHLYLRFVAIPKYSITSTILIREEAIAPTLSGLTNSTSEDLAKPRKNLDNEMQILRSRSLMLRVVKELGLYVNYYRQNDGQKELLHSESLPIKIAPYSELNKESYQKSIRVSFKSDSSVILQEGDVRVGEYKLGQPIVRTYGTFILLAAANFSSASNSDQKDIIITFVDPSLIAEQYSQQLTISSINKEASILNLALISAAPEQGRDMMNKLVEIYNKEAVEDKNIASSKKLEFLDTRLKSISSELTGVERNVERYKQARKIADVDIQTTDYIAQASAYQSKLADWATQIEVLESIERYLSQPTNQYHLVPSTLGIQDQTLLNLIGKFNEVQQERERMLRTSRETNPLVQSLSEQIIVIRANILEDLRNIKQGLVITSRNLRVTSGQFQNKISKAPLVERELQAKGREQSLKQSIYIYLLQKREEAALALAATISNSRVIDSAAISDQPVSPNRKMAYLLGLLLGVGLPLSVLYIRNQFNNKIENRKEVETLTTIPVLGEIAHDNRKIGIATQDNRSALTEMFGLVRANLSFATVGHENKVVLVTSIVSGEGKTFFSINLANSLAQTGKKVILLDLDLRKSTLGYELDLYSKPGISDYVVSADMPISDIVQIPAAMPRIMAISAGSIPPNPAELLMSPKLTSLIGQLKEQFDYIVIDTPPIGLVADAYSISSLATSTVCVVRYNHTSREQIKSIETIYEKKKFYNFVLVLNDSRASNISYDVYGLNDTTSKKAKERVAA